MQKPGQGYRGVALISELDELKRARGMFATVLPENVNTSLGSSASPAVDIADWDDSVDITTETTRAGHLLARWFGGPDDIPQNLVPLHGTANLRMRHEVEGRIACDSESTLEEHSMALKDLLEMVPPPAYPAWTGQGEDDWEDAQRQLGVRLPHDYRELISVYGGGTFCRTIEIVSPFGPRGLKTFHELCKQYFRAMASSFPVPQRKPRFSVFPDAGGNLALGGDELMGYLTADSTRNGGRRAPGPGAERCEQWLYAPCASPGRPISSITASIGLRRRRANSTSAWSRCTLRRSARCANS